MYDSAQYNYKYFWNKSHVNVLRFYKDGKAEIAFDHIASIRYLGYSAQAVFEFLKQEKHEKHRIFPNIQENSYTFYQYFHQIYFPTQNVKPLISEKAFQQLLDKTGSDQIVVIDSDEKGFLIIYTYTKSNGVVRKEIEADLYDKNREDTGASFTVDQYFSEDLVKKINIELKLEENMQTSWLFTGEIVNYFNTTFLEFLEKFLEGLDMKMPFNNRFYVDRYNLLNYWSVLDQAFYSKYFGSIFTKLPVTVFNLDLLPKAEHIRLNYETKKDQPFHPFRAKISHLFANERGKIDKFSNLSFDKGVLVFVTFNPAFKEKKKSYKHRKHFISQSFPSFKIKEFVINHNLLLQKKDSLWRISVSQNLYKSLKVGQKLFLDKRSRFVEEHKEIFLPTPMLKKEDLLVTNGQKVLKNEILNKPRNMSFVMQTKEYMAPVSGKFSAKYIENGFVSIKDDDMTSRDIGWILDKSPLVERVFEENTVEISLPSVTRSMGISKGQSFFGNIVVVFDFDEAKEYFDKNAGLILISKYSLNHKQIKTLYLAGFRSVIVPSIEGLELIEENYWSIFSLGVYSQSVHSFPDNFMKEVMLNQYEEAYFDTYSKELKLRDSSNTESSERFVSPKDVSKFIIGKHAYIDETKPLIKQTSSIKKGIDVEMMLEDGFKSEARVVNIDEDVLILLDKRTEKVFSASIDHVKLIT